MFCASFFILLLSYLHFFALSFFLILTCSHTLSCCRSSEFIIHNRWLNTSVTSGSFVFLALSFAVSLYLALSLSLSSSLCACLSLAFFASLSTYSWAQLSVRRRCEKLMSAFHLTELCAALSHTPLSFFLPLSEIHFISLSYAISLIIMWEICKMLDRNIFFHFAFISLLYFLFIYCIFFFFCHFYCLLGFFLPLPLSTFPFPLYNSLNKARKCCRRFADSKKQIDKKAYEKLCCKTWTECQKEMKKKKQSTVIWLYVV